MNFKKIEQVLHTISKPGRYIGNESGIPDKNFDQAPVRLALGYPDIYEIGMSNQGLKIIYDRVNKLDYAACERFFAPWTDFEAVLREQGLPLYALETRTPLAEFDVIGFSMQYELLFTNFLNLIELSGLNVFAKKRNEEDPIIICGGPGIVNPAPYSPFADLFYIGEAEGALELMLEKLHILKKDGADKETRLKALAQLPGLYSPRYTKNRVKRQINKDFHIDTGPDTYVIPNIDTVQNKLVVEIMRGCPNKCRFCQAGIIYKPHREKNIDVIIESINKGLQGLGVTEVTLSSLSSGDYSQVVDLAKLFLDRYSDSHISFSFPSIRVETFDTALLEKMSSVRKSGLTFAIESGSPDGQKALNKIVMTEKINEIVDYAVKHGWRTIKLYFMIGLPHREGKEMDDIIQYVDHILSLDRKLKINLNIAVFVPKAHTPYQYVKQLSLEESQAMFDTLREHYRRSRVKLKIHDGRTSFIEGFVARGDEKVGLAMYDAFKMGAKFDGWREHFRFEYYLEAFKNHGLSYEHYLGERPENESLPWDIIDVGVTGQFYHDELVNSQNKIVTENCNLQCDKECHICGKDAKKIISKPVNLDNIDNTIRNNKIQPANNERTYFLMEFTKTGLHRFIGHIDMINYFENIFMRSGLPILYSEGFNPHPRMQFSGALSLGVESTCELMAFYTTGFMTPDQIFDILTQYSQPEIQIKRLRLLRGYKKVSLFELIHTYEYKISFNKKNKNTINSIVESLTDREYTVQKKKNAYSGYYKDVLTIKELHENSIIFDLKSGKNAPGINFVKNELFTDLDILITRTGLFTGKDGKIISLYEI